MPMVRVSNGGTPTTLTFYSANSSTGDWTYITIPNDIVSKYSNFRVHLIAGNLSGGIKYASINSVSSFADIDAATSGTSITLDTDISTSGINILDIAGRGSARLVFSVTLSN